MNRVMLVAATLCLVAGTAESAPKARNYGPRIVMPRPPIRIKLPPKPVPPRSLTPTSIRTPVILRPVATPIGKTDLLKALDPRFLPLLKLYDAKGNTLSLKSSLKISDDAMQLFGLGTGGLIREEARPRTLLERIGWEKTIDVDWLSIPGLWGEEVGYLGGGGSTGELLACGTDAVYRKLTGFFGIWRIVGQPFEDEKVLCAIPGMQAGTYYAGTESGAFRFNERAGKWERLTSEGLLYEKMSVHHLAWGSSGELYGLMRGESASLYVLEPKAKSWRRLECKGMETAFLVDFLASGERIYAALGWPRVLVANSIKPCWGVYVSEDGGATFRRHLDLGSPVQSLVRDEKEGLIYATTPKGVHAFKDGPDPMRPKRLPGNVVLVTAAHGGRLVGVDKKARNILASRDGGVNWEKISLGRFANLEIRYLWAEPSGDLYVGTNKGCYRASWARVASR